MACVAVGIASIIGPKAFAKTYKDQKLGLAPYSGKLIKVLNKLTLKMDSGVISTENYIAEVAKHMSQLKLEIEFKSWIESHNHNKQWLKLYDASNKHRRPYLGLVFSAKNYGHVPHGHHGLTSIQVIVASRC